ncbi:hypothetical protein J6590_010057 [Homalodisca vitripennis]|nr:hypothetical protein J6590_010057 [Homalodisca vitripennis]
MFSIHEVSLQPSGTLALSLDVLTAHTPTYVSPCSTCLFKHPFVSGPTLSVEAPSLSPSSHLTLLEQVQRARPPRYRYHSAQFYCYWERGTFTSWLSVEAPSLSAQHVVFTSHLTLLEQVQRARPPHYRYHSAQFYCYWERGTFTSWLSGEAPSLSAQHVVFTSHLTLLEQVQRARPPHYHYHSAQFYCRCCYRCLQPAWEHSSL